MTLRLRLTLLFGLLCALALMLVALVGYTASVREQYLSLDRLLVVSARIVENGIRTYGRSYALETDTLGPTKDGVVMVMRSYSPKGELMYVSPSDPGLRPSRPEAPLEHPAEPAYMKVLPFPFLRLKVPATKDAAFGIMTYEGQRWRRYVIRVEKSDRVVGYVEALSPLGRLDDSAIKLARLLLNLVLFSMLAVLLVGWWIAGAALRPVARLTNAARAISESHDLAQRVQTSGNRDELGRLATTFNAMLGSLEAAWKSQQRFVGDASHELRAPLTVMRGNLELLRRHPHLGELERQEMLGEIERETTRMTRLVEDLLLLARSDAGSTLQRTDVNLRYVTLEALRDARRLSSGHHFVLHAPPEQFVVQGDRDRLRQLLLILLDNAVKYSPAGSTVTTELQRVEGELRLSVSDQGSGIQANDLPHIFERFYRADPARQRDSGGAGLGLSIAEWIATQLDARLWVAKTGPNGTTFCVAFPFLAVRSEQVERPGVPA